MFDVMKEIKLTQGKVALVDDENYEYLNQWKWHGHKDRGIWYAIRCQKEGNKIKRIAMHRVILKTPLNMVGEHINHDGLNNQNANLRNATFSQNQHNKRSAKNSTSKYLGVHYFKRRFIKSQIRFNGVNIYLGTFMTEEMAALAYDVKAKELFGEFANLNFK
jgi:hypothetical protein